MPYKAKTPADIRAATSWRPEATARSIRKYTIKNTTTGPEATKAENATTGNGEKSVQNIENPFHP